MSSRPPDPRLLGFLAAYDPQIAELALALREMMLEAAPDAVEAIYDAYNAVAIGFSFTGRLKDSFCHIATYSQLVADFVGPADDGLQGHACGYKDPTGGAVHLRMRARWVGFERLDGGDFEA